MIPKYIPEELSCLKSATHEPLVRATDFHTESLRGHFIGPEEPLLRDTLCLTLFQRERPSHSQRQVFQESSTPVLKVSPQLHCQNLHKSHGLPTSPKRKRECQLGEELSTGWGAVQRVAQLQGLQFPVQTENQKASQTYHPTRVKHQPAECHFYNKGFVYSALPK